MGSSAAITAAQNDVKNVYAIVDGLPFNKATTPLTPDFADRFGDYTRDVVRPNLIEQYGPNVAHAMQLSIAPDPREPGSFYLILTNTGGAAPFRDKEGNYIRFSQNEMLNQVIKAKEAKDRAAAEAAKSPFTSGLNVLQ